MLQAIAGAIAAGKLPPDDAFAWARIAAYEVDALSAGDTDQHLLAGISAGTN